MDVLLVSLTADVGEISALLASAGHRILETIVQRRDRPDSRTFVGRGKLEEIQARVDAGGIAAVVFNGELRPTMHYQLERDLGVECYDRLRVLLELFAQRASSREGKFQVELALLQYEVPLLREWIHEGDVGERPGFMAGGELRVDAYYETVKRRIKKIRDELEAIRRERAVRRSVRKERGYHLVALAGYANAGKSSLLNVLADERVVVDDRMFSTLATTTRSLTGTRKRILLTDTTVLDGRGVQRDARGDPPGGPRAPPRGRRRFGDGNPTEGAFGGAHALPESLRRFGSPGSDEGRPPSGRRDRGEGPRPRRVGIPSDANRHLDADRTGTRRAEGHHRPRVRVPD
ncbi:MAG: GTPase HflX [Methanobacteriota archaeon]|nr:MAG: GTPase HflX [Euryarchaeota archaeon]